MPKQLTRAMMIDLYQARDSLGLDTEKYLGLRMPVPVYFKDPLVAKNFPVVGPDEEFTTPWEPGLRDGPTSARFAVVDYDSSSNTLTAPAKWDRENSQYLAPDGTPLGDATRGLLQFHQLSVWAIVQNTLDFFESSMALGRRISWGFEGNRLIVVPHAGCGENAFYDRDSKSLQFYWFDGPDGRVYTCLSSDIVNHEFGHAVLDGLRPHFYESIGAQTAAFHEFLGDLTALLMAFSNNKFRRWALEQSKGNLDNATLLAGLAPEFGEAALDVPYLRSGLNEKTLEDLAGVLEPHDLSQVMTGAMFDILKGVFAKQRQAEQDRYQADPEKKPSDVRALAFTVPRMQTMAIQPLDLLPPCDVTFRDYARAVLRSEQVANPTDPKGYRAMMLDVFVKRGILTADERRELLKPAPVFRRPPLDVFHPVDAIAASRGGSYRFLDDNRAKLFIPLNADIVVSDLIRARKFTTDRRSLPEQVILQYIWREEVKLEGERFGQFAGQTTSLLCGGTLALDQNGNQIHWSRKPGASDLADATGAEAEQADGIKRRDDLLDVVAARVAAGMIGETITSGFGLLPSASPPFGFSSKDGVLSFRLAPHFSIREDHQNNHDGGRQWAISF